MAGNSDINNIMRKFVTILLLPILAGSLVWLGCNQRIVRTKTSGYTLQGAVVKNLDDSTLFAGAIFNRVDSVLMAATVKIGTTALNYDNGVYVKNYDSLKALTAGTYYLKLQDSSRLNDSVQFAVPVDLAIVNIAPDTRIFTSATQEVRIDFLASAGSNGYAYGVVKADSAYQINGYSGFVISQVNSATIPPDAFRNTAGDLDTGWYYIYIYAYSGAPAPTSHMPTSFPPGLTANITRLNLNGFWGTVVISPRDSMHVTSLQ
ncbi:hypothetical protein TRIP_C20291 [Candidatus Zixiibacteriota bacterium]|nr:hypothetical protein TRIP_C20291 [candidate division Zixibacteria bacterium]